MKKATLFKYLNILEKSLLFTKTVNLSGSFRSEKRLLRKLYPGSVNFLTLTVPPVAIGFKTETYIQSILSQSQSRIYLYHTRGKEVDFVIPAKNLAFEIKYQQMLHEDDFIFLKKYIKEKNYRAVVVTKDLKKEEKKITWFMSL